jgi:transforming growth factor-beta-induced protein
MTRFRARRTARSAATLTAALVAGLAAGTASADWRTDFDEGTRGWQVVLDGVMGGLSSGRLSEPEAGIVRFTGRLRLENNGGFSQARTQIDRGSLTGTDGIEIRVKGDGRQWNFDIRTANIRMMATGYQTSFDTRDGQWTTIRLPYSAFELQSFGRRVPAGPDLDPALIESVGVTLSDKKPGEFTLEFDAIRGYRESEPATASLAFRDRDGGADATAPAVRRVRAEAGAAGGAADLASVARDAGLTTLLTLVEASGIAEQLPSEPITILAPTNEAFSRLPEAEVRRLLSPEGRRDLQRILAHHVLPGRVPAAAAFGLRRAESLAGQSLAIEPGPSLVIGGARVLATDVAFDGGLVHVIDGVLIPETRTIAEVAAGVEDLSTLVSLVRQAGLLEQLGPRNDGPWTVFAPVNSAFAALPADLVAALTSPAGRMQLATVLGFHVVPGRVRLADLAGTPSLRTLSGEPVSVAVEGGGIRVGGAGIAAADIETANGVVHLLDAVMLPPSLASAAGEPTRGLPADAGMSAERLAARGAAVIERAIEIGAPLFNDGNIEACAATYTIALESLDALGGTGLPAADRDRLRRGLEEAARERDVRERAWVLRRTMDDLYRRFLNRRGTEA